MRVDMMVCHLVNEKYLYGEAVGVQKIFVNSFLHPPKRVCPSVGPSIRGSVAQVLHF